MLADIKKSCQFIDFCLLMIKLIYIKRKNIEWCQYLASITRKLGNVKIVPIN